MKYEVGFRVIFKPEVAEGRYYGATATIIEVLISKDLKGIPLRLIKFADGHRISVSVSELEPAPAKSGGTA